jgi:hypothetical protein
MAGIDDVAALVAELPETAEGEHHGTRTWSVRGNGFVWERPFSKADIKRFGVQTPPAGPILAVRVADLHDKEALLAAHPEALFTIPHFDGYAAVLIQLSAVSTAVLRDVLLDGWLAFAPTDVAEAHLNRRGPARRRDGPKR